MYLDRMKDKVIQVISVIASYMKINMYLYTTYAAYAQLYMLYMYIYTYTYSIQTCIYTYAYSCLSD